MTRTPVQVPDDLWKALAEHLDPEQIIELTATIAWEDFGPLLITRSRSSPVTSPRVVTVPCRPGATSRA